MTDAEEEVVFRAVMDLLDALDAGDDETAEAIIAAHADTPGFAQELAELRLLIAMRLLRERAASIEATEPGAAGRFRLLADLVEIALDAAFLAEVRDDREGRREMIGSAAALPGRHLQASDRRDSLFSQVIWQLFPDEGE